MAQQPRDTQSRPVALPFAPGDVAAAANAARVLDSLGRSASRLAGDVGKPARALQLFEAQAGRFSVGGLTANLGALQRGGALLAFDLTSGLGAAVGVIEQVAAGVVRLGEAIITTAAGAQDLNLAVRLNVGETQAQAIQGLADSFGNTRFDDDAIKSALLPLLDIGISDTRLLDDLSTAAADVSARRNTGVAGVQSALGAFERIANTRQVDGRALRELGVNEAEFFTNLGQLLGVSSDRAQKLVRSSKVSAQTLLSVAVGEIARREGGTLGTGALAAGQTIGATLERLSNLPGNLLKQLADSPGVKAVQGVLDNFVEVLLGPVGAAGVARLGNLFERIVTGLFGSLSGEQGAQRLTGAINGVLGVVDTVVRYVGEAWPVVTGIFDATAPVVRVLWSALRVVGDAVGTLLVPAFRTLSVILDNVIVPVIQYLSQILDKTVGVIGRAVDVVHGSLGLVQNLLGDGLQRAGLDSAAGFVRGLAAGAPDVKQAALGLASGVQDTVRTALRIRSPSQVLADDGAQTSAGFALGLERGGAGVDSAARRALADTTRAAARARLPAFLAAPSAANGLPPIEIVINIYAQTNEPSALAQEAAQAVRVELSRILTEATFQLGAA